MKKTYIKYIAALIIFGSNGAVASMADTESYETVFIRTLIGSLFLAAVLFISSLSKSLKYSETDMGNGNNKNMLPCGKLRFFVLKIHAALRKEQKAVLYTSLSGAAMGMSWILLFEAYDIIGVGVSSVLYYCGPVIVMALSPLIFGERLFLKKGILLLHKQIFSTMKKIAAIHDLSGYGRASLTVAIPILSYMGYQVCPLPTAILSAHSEYKDFRSFDLTDQMQGIIDHWKELDLHFDALYSGYLASEKQMNIVSGFFDDFSQDDNFILVDPVLGDHGKLYPGMDTGMITGMRELCKKANVITPNLTEAAFLLDTAPSPHTPPAEAIEWCKALSKLGPEYVIITSAPSGNEKKVATLAYNKNDERLWRVSSDYVAASYPGTGDAFASVITGCLLNGDSLPEAIERAVHFINMGIKATFGYTHNPLDGMNQEKVLHYLNESLPYFTYELLPG